MPRKESSKYRIVPCPCPADHISQQFSSKRLQNPNGDDTQNSGLAHCMRVAEGHEDKTVICTNCSDRWGHSQASLAMFKTDSQTNSLTQAMDYYPTYKGQCSSEGGNPLEWKLYYRKWLSQGEAGATNVADIAQSTRKRRKYGSFDPTKFKNRTITHSENAIRGWQSRRITNEAPEETTSIGVPGMISETYTTLQPPICETDFNVPQEGSTTSYGRNVSYPFEAFIDPNLLQDSTVEGRLYSALLSEGYGAFDSTGYGHGMDDYSMTGMPSSCGYSTNPDYTEPGWDTP
ncbi:hypothetical protein I203_100223 [Kwoniella mangroviensis CBS 8507]|uniref:uncharacterized protein n=1 Tax=Kwoniella mangroviensis CBS 8507 TaxID=1296122 RepID=UPI00080D1D67|nr:uncharacterized protein I203_05905 [Kwoniella mangroviensis CBS 8507]OCF65163.1 hypothetical protein I203_05905 [Kwoniella mangroviensis CBS 8507]